MTTFDNDNTNPDADLTNDSEGMEFLGEEVRDLFLKERSRFEAELSKLESMQERKQFLKSGLTLSKEVENRLMEASMAQYFAVFTEYADANLKKDEYEEIFRKQGLNILVRALYYYFENALNFLPVPMKPEIQGLLDEANEAQSDKEAADKARQILDIDPNCTQAWLLLCLQTDDLKNAVRLARKAVETGRESLNEEVFTQYAKDVGEYFPAHPFLDALHLLSQALWYSGEFDEALDICEKLLRLNPGDKHGIRHNLIHHYLALGRTTSARMLIRRYNDRDCVFCAWAGLLLMLVEKGIRSKKTLGHLRKATKINYLVPDYLLGYRSVHEQTNLNAYESLTEAVSAAKEEEEAKQYAIIGREAWVMNEDALNWLEAFREIVMEKGKSGES